MRVYLNCLETEKRKKQWSSLKYKTTTTQENRNLYLLILFMQEFLHIRKQMLDNETGLSFCHFKMLLYRTDMILFLN